MTSTFEAIKKSFFQFMQSTPQNNTNPQQQTRSLNAQPTNNTQNTLKDYKQPSHSQKYSITSPINPSKKPKQTISISQPQPNYNVMTYLKGIFFQQQIQCIICMNKIKVSEMVKFCNCEHQYCKSCVSACINMSLSEYALIKCPDEKCLGKINRQTTFYKSLPEKVKMQIQKIVKFHFTSNDPYMKLCPSQECQGIIPLLPAVPVVCNACRNQFCAKCLYFKHQGKCANNQVQYLNSKYRYRNCTSCGIIVEKIEACNHITCRCGYEFCYGCGAKWLGGDHRCAIVRQPVRQRNQNGCFGNGNQSVVKKIFKFAGRLILTMLLLIVVSLYAIVCLFPMILITIIGGVLTGSLLLSFAQIFNVCKKDGVGLGLLLIIFFPIAMVLGICEAFKGFWGQAFLFWWRILAQAIQKPLGQIWT